MEKRYCPCRDKGDFDMVSQTVRDLRAQIGMTQEQFCKFSHIPRRTLQSWESGERIPPAYVLDLLRDKVESMEARHE